MGKYCDVCKVKDLETSFPIQEIRTIEYIDGKWYSSHRGMVCQACREKILCGLDIIPNALEHCE